MHDFIRCRMEPECLLPDRISNLPSSLVQTILTLIPIRDAYRTSILSRNWRHRCVNLPKLEFDDKLLEKSTTSQLSIKCKVVHAIYTVLLLHRGPVLEFSLCVSQLPSCCEIDQIIMHLANNTTVEKFNLVIGLGHSAYKIPSSFFSLKRLTHINLKNCVVHLQSTSFRFERLTSLCFHNVNITNKMLICFISCCPILKSLTLVRSNNVPIGEEKHFVGSDQYSDLVQLFQLLPLIEHLEMNCCPVKVEDKGVIPQSLPNKFVHLRALVLHGLSFGKEDELRFVILLVTSSPNLKKIRMEMNCSPTEAMSQTAMNLFELQDYAYVKLDHLDELEITNFGNMKPGMDFLKLILAKSSMLKKVRVVINNNISVSDEVKMLRDVLWNPCASVGAQIKFERA
ncbi:putative F-box domain, leucine-rich repeat domain superfamily, F-box-like domain superfamily [Helianthus annuus]|nr:putative F-box domain, leucine-rich repeat domain superfamily, F-box-like domain superfamily [Helianthus annuus]